MRARLSGVTKFHGAQVVLENASLEVGPRARIGLVGPNGVGKSTVLRLLAGEEAPDAGVVALDPPRRRSPISGRSPSAVSARRCAAAWPG